MLLWLMNSMNCRSLISVLILLSFIVIYGFSRYSILPDLAFNSSLTNIRNPPMKAVNRQNESNLSISFTRNGNEALTVSKGEAGYKNEVISTTVPTATNTANELGSAGEVILPSARNVTPPLSHLLFYNRVPKCGSSTVNTILKGLAERNSYLHKTSHVFHTRWISTEKRKALLQELTEQSKKKALSFDRHVYYFSNISYDDDSPRPIWINVVREPVERFISEFYYMRIRSPLHSSVLKRYGRDLNEIYEMNLDKCVPEGDPLCLYKPGDEKELLLTFFCGHAEICREVGNRRALEKAKYNIENYYSVVGVLEELPLSLEVFQHYIPNFFAGATSLRRSTSIKANSRSSAHKPNVSSATKESLRSFLKEDLDLYQFIRQRLYLQARALAGKNLLQNRLPEFLSLQKRLLKMHPL